MKKILKTIVIALITMLLVACGGSGGDGETSDTLHIGISNTIVGFNPINNTEAAANWILRFMYPTLLDQPESTNFQPNLAESFESEDGKLFTIKIKEDAVWSDGEPITSHDVAFTLNTAAHAKVESSLNRYLQTVDGTLDTGKLAEGETEISGVKVINDKELTITTKVPVDPNYIKEVIGFNIFILPKHYAEKMDLENLGSSELATTPKVTGGAYKFVAYEQGQHVELAANEKYYKGEAIIKSIFVIITDGTGLVTKLQAGDIQMIGGAGIGVLTPDDVASLKNNENLKINSYDAFNTQLMYVNNEVFDNREVRQAIAHAINKQRIVDELLKGDGRTITSIYPNAHAYYDDSLPGREYDVEKAKELLAKSGFDTSKEIELLVPTGNKVRMDSANLIQQDLEAVGFKVKQKTFDFTSMLNEVKQGKFELALMGLSYNSDPDNTGYFSPKGNSNYNKLTNPDLTALWEKGLELTSKKEREPVYSEIQAMYIEEAYMVGLYSAYQYSVQDVNLDGGLTPYWYGSLAEVHKWSLKK